MIKEIIKEPVKRFFYQYFKMKKSNRIISIIFILLCIYAFIETTRFPNLSAVDYGPSFMPRIAAGLLAGLSIMLFISTFKKQDDEKVKQDDMLKLLFHICYIIAFALVVSWLGVLITVPIFLFVYILIYGKIKIYKNIFLSLVITAALYGLFVVVLRIPLPNPLF